MRVFTLALLLFVFSFADESFITKKEYASMLYKNPRGIGCHKCHGIKGEGKVIARYVAKKGPKTLLAPNISNLDYREFKKALKHTQKVMPRYYLTDKEIESLYYYIKMKKKED